MTQVVWLKRDLRIRDHAPLFQASQLGTYYRSIFLEPFLFEKDVFSKRHLTFIVESLEDLKASFASIGLPLFVYIGDAKEIFQQIYDTYGTFCLHSHMEHGTNLTYERDLEIKEWTIHHQVTWTEYKMFGVNRAHGFKYRLRDFHGWLKEGILPIPKDPQPFIDHIKIFKDTLKELLELEVKGASISFLKGGESEGIKRAKAFFDQRYKKYQVYINKPALSIHSSSLLSPYLAFLGIYQFACFIYPLKNI